ncbi:MAG: hypothetical protein J1E43_04090 [Christensenellaceae bacterium]|nr:hypothetical protein [Christensenellaceae bacterium]
MKKMMVLFAVLILSCLTAFGGFAEPATTPQPPSSDPVSGVRTVFEDQSLKSVFLGEERVYVLDHDGVLWAWNYQSELDRICELPVYQMENGYYDTTGEELRRLEDAVFDVVESDGKLYALNAYSGRIGTVDGEGVHWTADFDGSVLVTSDGWTYWTQHKVTLDGALYLLVDRNALGVQVIRIDLTSGAVNLFNAPDAITMCAQGDRLLLIRMPWDEEAMMGGDMSLIAMDPGSGEITELPVQLPNNEDWSMGLAATEDAVYILTNAVFYMSRDGEAFEALQQGPDYTMEMRALPQGAMAYRAMGVNACTLAEEPADEKLVVRGNGFMDEIRSAFMAKHPGALLQLLDGSVNAADVADRIRGGDTETDVFVVRVDAAFGTLIEKGYAAPLDDHPVIAASAEKMFPVIRSALTDSQGRLMAYPEMVDVDTWGYNAELWPQHFAGREMPTTYLELFQMMREFLEDDDGDYFFDMYSYPTMIKYVIDAYVAAHGDETVFSSPALREPLNLLAEVQQTLRERRLDSWDVYEIYSELDDSYHCLLWRTVAYSDNQASLGYNDHSFFLTVDGEPSTQTYMYALIVNPLSERQELAKDFVAVFARPDMSPVRYAMLHTDAQPSTRINRAGEEEWVVSPEALEDWADTAQTLRFGEHDMLKGDRMAEQMKALIARYVDGQLTLDMMLEQMDGVAAMILNEQQ